jgi:hypothetical protein
MYCIRLGLAKQEFAHAMKGSHFRSLERAQPIIRESVVSTGASFADSVLLLATLFSNFGAKERFRCVTP